MMLLLLPRPRLSDSPPWLQRRPMPPLRPQGEPVRRSRSLLTRDKWPPEDLLSRRPSETCGPRDPLVCRWLI
jgi:hypothetical protein